MTLGIMTLGVFQKFCYHKKGRRTLPIMGWVWAACCV